jgi:hypothetical protein
MCDVNNILLFYFVETERKINSYICNMMLKYTSEIQTTDSQSLHKVTWDAHVTASPTSFLCFQKSSTMNTHTHIIHG